MGEHVSSHAYSIYSDRVPVLIHDWEARDERRLLDLILECGYGNWWDISRRLGKPMEECKNHYDSMYLGNPPDHAVELRNSGIPLAPFIPTPLPPHLFRLGSDNPPRMHSSAPGYNAFRSEFDVNHDHNDAEQDLAMLEIDDSIEDQDDANLIEALQLAVVEIYNSRLKERARRCRIIRQHGLIMPQKTYVVMARFSSTLGRAVTESLAPFAQLLTGLQFDYFLEGLHMARELQERSNRLSELRSCGLKSFQSAKLMQRLSEIRAMQKREQKANNLPILQGVSGMEAAARNPSSRRPAPPLEISCLPFYEKLSPQERELCAHARIVPESFLEFKSLLAAECKKNDGLRLAQARRCIKIDVNKTRRLFDFLMEQGIIFPPKNK